MISHDDPEKLIVSNLIENPKAFITEIVSPNGLLLYDQWKNRQSFLYYNLAQDLNHFESIKDLKKMSRSGIPAVIERYIASDISPETVVLIDAVINKLDEWQKIDHPLIERNLLKLRKYRPFVNTKPERIKQTFLKKYSP